MHSHARTLISRLGFADPDKKDRRHDLACQYLVTPEVAKRIVQEIVRPGSMRFLDGKGVRMNDRATYRFQGRADVIQAMATSDTVLEWPLKKGTTQSIVGFLDVVLPFLYQAHFDGTERVDFDWRNIQGHKVMVERCYSNIQQRVVSEEGWQNGLFVVEVKTNEVGVGDLLRQIKFYREFQANLRLDDIEWIVATLYPMSDLDVDTLWSEEIRHIHLGAPFEAWALDQERARLDAQRKGAEETSHSLVV